MKLKLLIVVMLFFMLAMSPAKEPKMKKIFNGKNLKGWIPPENNIWWSVEDGVLIGKSGPEKKGSIMWTKKEYKDFIVQADFKMGEGTIDSGIFLRSRGQHIQIGFSGSMKRDMTGSPYIGGKGYPVEAKVESILKKNDWNTMKVQVIGKDIVTWLNGQQVMTYTEEDMPEKGPIGVQIHSGNEMVIYFRDIKVAKL